MKVSVRNVVIVAVVLARRETPSGQKAWLPLSQTARRRSITWAGRSAVVE
jgi:hypothetical protein